MMPAAFRAIDMPLCRCYSHAITIYFLPLRVTFAMPLRLCHVITTLRLIDWPRFRHCCHFRLLPPPPPQMLFDFAAFHFRDSFASAFFILRFFTIFCRFLMLLLR